MNAGHATAYEIEPVVADTDVVADVVADAVAISQHINDDEVSMIGANQTHTSVS